MFRKLNLLFLALLCLGLKGWPQEWATVTWHDGDMINGASFSSSTKIYVEGDVTVKGQISCSVQVQIIPSGTKEGNRIIKRADGFTNKDMFYVREGANLSITSDDDHTIVIDGNGIPCDNYHAVYVTSSSVNFKGVVFRNNYVDTFTASLTSITNNDFSIGGSSQVYKKCGGAVCLYNSYLTSENCSYTNNKALHGGAILLFGGSVSCKNDTFDGNVAELTSDFDVSGDNKEYLGPHGGAILCYSGDFTSSGCTYMNNMAKTEVKRVSAAGGAVDIYHKMNSATFRDDTFKENKVITVSSYKRGGAIHCISSMECTNCTFQGNEASHGGGIAVRAKGNAIITGGKFFENKAEWFGEGGYSQSSRGAAIYVSNTGNDRSVSGSTTASATIKGVEIYDNVCVDDWTGGIYSRFEGTTVTITEDDEHNKTDIHHNKSAFGGNGSCSSDGAMLILGKCHIHHNSVLPEGTNFGGGGVFVGGTTQDGATLEIGEGCEIDHNSASCGAGLYVKANMIVNISGGSIHDNTCDNWGYNGSDYITGNGGGIYIGGNSASGSSNGTFSMTSGEIYSNKAVSKTDSEATSGRGGGVYIGGGTVTIGGGKIFDNVAPNYGGGMYVGYGNVTYGDENGIGSPSICNNRTDKSGGGLYLSDGDFSMVGGSIGSESDNNANTTTDGPNQANGTEETEGHGGGIFVNNGTFTMSKGTIAYNMAAHDGGGFYVNDGGITIEGTNSADISIDHNNATCDGGGFYANGGNVDLKDANIASNVATGNGGGVYSNGGEFTISNTSGFAGGILSNEAANGGGGYVNGGTLEITGGNIDNNSVRANGGGFYVNGGTLNLYGGIIGQDLGNHATGNGGGFYLRGGEANILQGTDETSATVQLNTATNGAGLYIAGNAEANFEDGTIQNNGTTSGNGGGIYLADNSQLKMSGTSTITGNHVPATGKGGGVFKQGGTNTVLWVSGNGLKIVNNYAGTTANRSNAYLNSYYDYITVDENHGLSDQVQLGVSVNVTNLAEDLPTPIIHSENMEVVNDIFYLLKHPNGDNGLFDDAARYVAVYQSTPDPFNDNEIFFMGTWAVEVGEVPSTFWQEGQTEVNISSPEGLSWFMILVNGLNGHQAHPGLGCTMVADISLEGSFWTPIGEWDHNDPYYDLPSTDPRHKDKPIYTGVFDGQGHTISIVSTCGIIGYYNYGLFGRTEGATVKNIVLADCSLVAGEAARMGGLIGEMNGGTVENCTVSGNINPSGSETIEDNPYSCVLGGLIGETKGACQIRNCIATEEINATAKEGTIYPGMQAYTVGGLVGMTSAGTVIENCFANPEIHHSGKPGNGTDLKDYSRYVGGLIGENYGIVRNCYVRLERESVLTGVPNPTDANVPGKVSKFGMFAGLNANGATMEHCFYPNEDLRHANITAYNANLYYTDSQLGTSSGHGQYNAVVRPYTYTTYLVDNQVSLDGGSGYGNSEATTLLGYLNAWVGNNATYSHWMRTEGSDVNDDYPVFRYDNLDGTLNYTVVGSKDRVHLEYDNSFNEMYERFEPGKKGCLFIYKTPWTGTIDNQQAETITANNMAIDNHISIYVEEDVALLQDGNAPTLKNVYPCQTIKGKERAWHLISSSLADSPTGFKYGTTTEVTWNEQPDPCNVNILTNSVDDYKTFFPSETTVVNIDLYNFYEPEYHWLNLKRNRLSHWHVNKHDANIEYSDDDNLNSDSHLIPARGYLMAIGLIPAKEDNPEKFLLQAGGKLNNGEITIDVTAEAGFKNETQGIPAEHGTELKGYNLLGNPYQSYLSFARFAEVNGTLWSESTTPSYAVFDAESDFYIPGTAAETSKGSFAAQGDINMHQGFFIVADNPGTAKFDNTMRSNVPLSGTHFRGEGLAYPLVNLVVTDATGTGDVAVVEFDRPEYKAAAKMKHIGADGKIYFHYNNEDHALLFLNEDIDQLPVRFDAIEDGTYTMTWSTANATFSYLHLIDNMTGIDVDMLTSDAYTFTASSSDYKSRFKLMFAYTGVEENEAASTSSASFAFMHDGALTVNGEGMLEVIDMSGRTIVSSRLTDAQNTVSLPQAAQGVYVLRLTNDNQSKVQKIVIE